MKPLLFIGICCFAGALHFAKQADELNRATYPWFFDNKIEQPVLHYGDGVQQKQAAAAIEVKKLDDYSTLCAVGGITALALGLVVVAIRKTLGKQKVHSSSLDVPLMNWSETDAMTIRDLLNGGILVMGRTGSGKTSSSGLAIAEGIINA